MKTPPLTVLMAAAECRGIAKVGGLADVVYDLSQSLQQAGHHVSVVLPAYSSLPVASQPVLDFLVRFGGQNVPARLHRLVLDGLTVYQVASTYFQGDWGAVYIDSGTLGRGPFEDDAQRFAFFSAAIWTLVKTQQPFASTEVLHCHDWHTAWIPLLQRLEQAAPAVRTLFTIHNLDYQGTRPLDEAYAPGASFRQWFPEHWDALVSSPYLDWVRDPAAPHCFNPMRTGIRLADAVNTVSPTYADEITRPDRPEENFFGGRGLEPDLLLRKAAGRLVGILNGMDYVGQDPERLSPPFSAASVNLLELRHAHRKAFLKDLPDTVVKLAARLGPRMRNAERALAHVDAFVKAMGSRPLVVCVTRAVRQKLSLMVERLDGGQSVFDEFLKLPLGLLVIGTGELEHDLEALNEHANALYLNAFDAGLAQQFYSVGDLFLMPSDFEPCGLSQLQALRFGCLPLVHDRGGLHDTVEHLKTGFVFAGSNRVDAAHQFLRVSALAVKTWKQRELREQLVREAMTRRYTWDQGTDKYVGFYRKILAGA